MLCRESDVIGTLISVLRNAANFVISAAWALTAKITSLLCICTRGGEQIAGRILTKAHRIDDRHAIRRSATV